MWFTDPKTGKPSVTLTILMCTSVVALVKLLLSGVIIADFTLGTFSGTDFAAVLGSAGAIYAARKHTDSNSSDK